MKNVDNKKTTLQRLHLFLAMQQHLLKETKYILIIRTIKKKRETTFSISHIYETKL